MKSINSNNKDTNSNKRLGVWLFIIAAVLTVPFTTNAPWSGGDYIIGGVLLFSAALAYELLAQKMNNRLIVGFLVVAVLFLVWAELSVGVFGTPFAGQ